MIWDTIIIGGGACGFFTAINIKEKNPDCTILIIEKDKEVLKKVKISGGGRCNITNACFNPTELVEFYPRGNKELLGPFHKFCTGDMMAWLDERGIPLKIEADNRVFPKSNKSQTIVDYFVKSCAKNKVKINKQERVEKITKNQHWSIKTQKESYLSRNLVISTGSNPKVWSMLAHDLAIPFIPPVPSLFTFNSKDESIRDLQGISFPNVIVSIPLLKTKESGPLLITHWGLSGPAILKLSAREAISLNSLRYQFTININFKPNFSIEDWRSFKSVNSAKKVIKNAPFNIPKRFWERNCEIVLQTKNKNWADLTNKELQDLFNAFHNKTVKVFGKSTFKDEFVTAGGVDLTTIDFKTFQSKLHPKLYFGGEVLNIDALTGGFNFQAAWTAGWHIAEDISKSLT